MHTASVVPKQIMFLATGAYTCAEPKLTGPAGACAFMPRTAHPARRRARKKKKKKRLRDLQMGADWGPTGSKDAVGAGVLAASASFPRTRKPRPAWKGRTQRAAVHLSLSKLAGGPRVLVSEVHVKVTATAPSTASLMAADTNALDHVFAQLARSCSQGRLAGRS